MKILFEKIRKEKLYSVGYCEALKKYVLSSVIPWAAWYSRYYEITPEEYNSFGSVELDELASAFHKQGISSERFLFSERKSENTEVQQDLFMTVLSESDDR